MDEFNYLILCGIIAVILFAAIIFISKKKKSIQYLNRLKGIEFEEYLHKLLLKQGYNCLLTSQSHDFGADLIIENFGYNDEKIVIQAKNYENNVSISAIQEVFTAMYYYDADYAICIVTSDYTASAVKLAEKVGVILINGEDLSNIIAGELLENYL